MGVTLITGASSGIGRSLARRVAASDETVVVLARRKDLLDSLVEEIEQAGGRALALQCDVTDRGEVLETVGHAEQSMGPIDRLIANAGGGGRTEVETFQAAQIESALALNVVGTANCIEAVLPSMLERGRGHIVATSSLAAYRGLPSAAAYSAAKAALTNMMESLRLDLKPHGIDVTVILPGFVRKPSSRKQRKPFHMELEETTRRMHKAILARRRVYAFPLALVLAVNFGRILPAPLYDRLLGGLKSKRKKAGR